MSVIEGASVAARTMADGTLRLSIDIEPRNAQAAFALFGAPGRAVALAALVDGAGAVREPEKPKGGEWAKLAGMWCNDPDFWAWASSFPEWTVGNASDAAEFVMIQSEIKSRADLDHSAAHLDLFNERVRWPFMRYMQARGIKK